MVLWRALIAEAAEALATSGVPNAKLDADRIGQQATGAEGVEWFEQLEAEASTRQVAKFDAMVARRRTGEPLQYVVGSWGFRTLDLFVDQRVLIPRPETEIVAEHALAALDAATEASAEPGLVVDLGTGSGAIGLSIAVERPGTEVWLTDESEDALAVARANLAGLGRRGRRVRVACGDWFAALDPELRGRIDVIVSNPPYVAEGDEIGAEVTEWEPRQALFAADEGYEHLRLLVETAGWWLAPNGSLVLEMAPWQVPVVADLAASRFEVCGNFADLAGKPRGVVASRSKSS